MTEFVVFPDRNIDGKRVHLILTRAGGLSYSEYLRIDATPYPWDTLRKTQEVARGLNELERRRARDRRARAAKKKAEAES